MVFGNELLRLARPFPVVLLLLGIRTFLALRKGRRRFAFALWVVVTVPILGVADGGISVVTQDRSQRAAAEIAASPGRPEPAWSSRETTKRLAGSLSTSANRPSRRRIGSDMLLRLSPWGRARNFPFSGSLPKDLGVLRSRVCVGRPRLDSSADGARERKPSQTRLVMERGRGAFLRGEVATLRKTGCLRP
jgi:hypothetical protein